MASHDRRLNSYADVVAGLPQRTSNLEARSAYAHILKPAVETVLAILALIPAAIIIAVCALLIARDGHSPFYRQTRIGGT